jgi:threonyl-tRNA synthetase
VQVDYAMAERFELAFADAGGREQRPVIVHRAILGSFERFLAILLEHTDGVLPGWLAPLQALVMPIADRHRELASELQSELVAAGVRAELEARGGPLAGRVREAQRLRVPFVAVIGDRELETGQIAVRERHNVRWSAPAPEVAARITEALRR